MHPSHSHARLKFKFYFLYLFDLYLHGQVNVPYKLVHFMCNGILHVNTKVNIIVMMKIENNNFCQ